MTPRIAVLGAGAIGGFIAAALSRAGFSVCAVARGDHLREMQREGLRVRSEIGDFTARFPAAADLREFDPPDWVLLTFKSHQWPEMLPQLEPAVRAGSAFVTLQNGLPFWYERDRPLQSVDPGGRIRDALPYASVAGGVVHVSGRIERPGEVRQSGGLLYPIGELDGTRTPRIQALSQAFARAGLDAPVEDDIRRIVWRKLLGNVALNPVSALTRARVATLLRDPGTRALMLAIVQEGLDVARATGVEVGVTAEKRLQMAEHIADVKTSMLQDLEAGKPLELGPICGAVVELAAEHGVPVPHTQTVYALTALLEKSTRR